MRRHNAFIAFVLMMSMLLCSCNSLGFGVESSSNLQENTGYVPFPDGYGYMENLTVLAEATEDGDRAIIRDHAWKLWAGIMQPMVNLDWPLWYSWPNTKAAFAPDPMPTIEESEPVVTANSKIKSFSGKSLIATNLAHRVDGNTPAPIYDIPQVVLETYPNGICSDKENEKTLCDGPHFLFNGDILIPTESLTQEAMTNIRGEELYLQSTLDKLHGEKLHQLDLTQKFIATKHMYWPVKADGITGVPVWKDNFPNTFSGYAGYEKWDTLVGVDPSGQSVGQVQDVAFLYGVKDHSGKTPLPTIQAEATIYGLDDFYHHKITEDDWNSFNDADKAILNAASYWANNQPIGVGDYLISIAMHVNTKELPSWTMQSVWWSDEPDQGIYAADRPELPQAQGPWDHYLMTDSYAVPPDENGNLDIAVNPYIEGVIHPIATSCRNCHIRGGWPTKVADKSVNKEIAASYQDPLCPGLLTDLSEDDDCLRPLTLTDYLWIIPDRAIVKAG